MSFPGMVRVPSGPGAAAVVEMVAGRMLSSCPSPNKVGEIGEKLESGSGTSNRVGDFSKLEFFASSLQEPSCNASASAVT